ncbi:rpsU-divergently transcribed protein [endosymbiont of Acanthamoeba sp. UWC8]|uniref:COQ9 family protein n=1 Tax=endosymbiont of Acanthamoeba sp. UWC8 TaxID=86106 RepID=UPI0004D1B8D1|nr:COQ9 family protein [endosymbiont of Acanthamoeba sp. UWC8]AIF81940.1 rpsU-divergently transcribed protein [endosymbiont of Acanthamoeba sp. UWC8]
MTKQDIIKEKILEEIIKLVPQSGWGVRSLEQASQNAGYNKYLGEVVFENGIDRVIEYFIARNEMKMIAELKKLSLDKMRVRDRIIAAIKIKLSIYAENKDVIAKTVAYLSIPFKSPLGLKLLWQAADIIWYEAGFDKSTDFNYYTKRTLLSSVYSSTLIYWLNDNSMNHQDTIGFLERRIDNVISIGKFLNPRK